MAPVRGADAADAKKVKFPPPPPGAERRRHQRLDVFATVELEWEEDVLVAAVLNLSMGGAFVELPPGYAVEAGATVQIQLSAGDHTASQAARVVRFAAGSPPGFAAAWIAPSAETLTVLAILLGPSQLSAVVDPPRHAPGADTRARPGELPLSRRDEEARPPRRAGKRGDGAERGARRRTP